MCLSPEVDVIATVAIGAVAVDTLRNNKDSSTIALACIPALFCLHTLSSALVWWSERGVVPHDVGHYAAKFFIAVAFVVLPLYVPFAVLRIEPVWSRQAGLVCLSICGFFAAWAYATQISNGNATYVVDGYYLDFHVAGVPWSFSILYGLATCGATLLSSARPLVLWGMVNLVAIGGLALWASHGLPSLWCFWAACTSGCIAWFMRWENPKSQTTNQSV